MTGDLSLGYFPNSFVIYGLNRSGSDGIGLFNGCNFFVAKWAFMHLFIDISVAVRALHNKSNLFYL